MDAKRRLINLEAKIKVKQKTRFVQIASLRDIIRLASGEFEGKEIKFDEKIIKVMNETDKYLGKRPN